MKRYVDVSKWLYGEGPDSSFLHRASDGKECCLGQWAAQAGVSVEKLAGKQCPYELFNDDTVLVAEAQSYFDTFVEESEDPEDETVPYCTSDYAQELMDWNDRKTSPHGYLITLQQRIAKMCQIGEEHGDEIIFLNVPDTDRCW